MKTRVHHLRNNGIGCAWFTGDEGEKFILGDLELAKSDFENDEAPVEQARFVVNGKIKLKSNLTEVEHSRETPIPKRSNPNGGIATISEGPATLFCLGSTNAMYNFVSPHKWDLLPNESIVIAKTGFLALAEGEVEICGKIYPINKIIKLSGKEIKITAGAKGALVAVLEIDFSYIKPEV